MTGYWFPLCSQNPTPQLERRRGLLLAEPIVSEAARAARAFAIGCTWRHEARPADRIAMPDRDQRFAPLGGREAVRCPLRRREIEMCTSPDRVP